MAQATATENVFALAFGADYMNTKPDTEFNPESVLSQYVYAEARMSLPNGEWHNFSVAAFDADELDENAMIYAQSAAKQLNVPVGLVEITFVN